MRRLYDDTALKEATNLSINSELLAKARKLNINLSATLEHVLEDELRRYATLNNTNAKRLCPVIHLDEGNFVGSLWIPDWYSGLSLGLGRQRSQDSVGS